MRVLVAGCGAMGLPMAESLLAANISVVGFDTEPSSKLQQSPLTMLPSVYDAHADTLLIVVRTAADMFDLCFDKQAVFSSQNPLVEAPMSGAPVAAREQRLSFMLAGDNATLDRHQALFDVMGKQCFRVGELGAGMLVKTLNNTAAATSVLITRRLLNDAKREGVDAQLLLNVLNASSGGTWFSSQFDTIDWANEGFASNSTIGILAKDVRCALSSLTRQEDAFDRELLQALQQLTARTP